MGLEGRELEGEGPARTEDFDMVLHLRVGVVGVCKLSIRLNAAIAAGVSIAVARPLREGAEKSK